MFVPLHRPVLLEEVLKMLDPKPGQTFIDATVNGGGHARAIRERVGPAGKVLGIDWDCELVNALKNENQQSGLKNFPVVCENYANLGTIAKQQGASAPDGILFDLGFSSYHPTQSGRGFSFRKNELLDMRYHATDHDPTARDIINTWDREAIATLLRAYGEERYARRIAAGIANARSHRPIQTTGELAEVVYRSVPPPYRHGRIHPATRTFQALRIAVNHELENVSRGLSEAIRLLAPGRRVAIISFHSLEDRIVKKFFQEQARELKTLRILTPKPIRASRTEVRSNPQARSARLRVAEKLP